MPRGIPLDRTSDAVDAPEQAPVTTRALEMRRERRRRSDGDLDYSARMKLAIPKEIQDKLKREGKTPRWVRDDAGRMQQMVADDWDRVEGVEPVAASRSEDGQLILMAKFEDWYREDRKPIEELNRSRERSALDGKAGSLVGEGGSESVAHDGIYQPKGAQNRIS